MKATILRIATRKSPLALWQAHSVKKALEIAHPNLTIEIFGMMTEGDKLLASPLAEIGGKGLFVKELEKAILRKQADIAVHSIKDLPLSFPDHLTLGVVCERDDPRDAFISRRFDSLDTLPVGAVIGTSSSRRTSQIKAFRPDLQPEILRGNVGTRLMRLDEGRYDAIILAAAGLERLSQTERIRSYLPVESWIPAVGQGAIGIECREDNDHVLELIRCLEHPPTRWCITAERAMNQALNGGCQLPIAAYATLEAEILTVRGMVGDLPRQRLITASVRGHFNAAEELGRELAQQLLQQGAGTVLGIG